MGGSPYNPKQVIFAPTAQCNLHCGHCRVDRHRGKKGDGLTIAKARDFLRDCAENGIERVGFSGGEPFLAHDFLTAICEETVELDLYFDRLMTNGDWYQNETELTDKLEGVYNAGFDGTIGLSLDDWHGQESGRIALFINTVIEISGRPDGIEIDSALNTDGSFPIKLIEGVVAEMGSRFGRGACLINDGGIPAVITGDEGFRITITGIPYSRGADDPAAWKADKWFEDDWCLGPGNVLYIHADGSAAACCGFANERPELILGTVNDRVSTLIDAGVKNGYPRLCYQSGLGMWREALEKRGIGFPGKTEDICFFCDWLCSQGLTGTPGKP